MNVSRLCVRNRPMLIRLAEKEDYGQVLEFLKKNFLPLLPTYQPGIASQSPENREHYTKIMGLGTSVLAFTDDTKQELVGVALANKFNEDISREYLKKLKDLSIQRGYPNDLSGIIFAEEMKLQAKIEERYNVKEALYMAVGCIRSNFKRLSLGRIIVEKSIYHGAQLGLKVAIELSYTDEGKKMIERLGFEPIYTQKFVDYCDHRGKFIYSTVSPEARVTVHNIKIAKK